MHKVKFFIMKNYSSKQINEKIVDIQMQWADGIVKIGKAYLDKKDYVKLAEKFIDNLYYFQNDKILFKPTKASYKQFRIKRNEFISYFIGHNKVSEEDIGFALEPWKIFILRILTIQFLKIYYLPWVIISLLITIMKI